METWVGDGKEGREKRSRRRVSCFDLKFGEKVGKY